MELKFMNVLEPIWVSICSNRTFMELKFQVKQEALKNLTF